MFENNIEYVDSNPNSHYLTWPQKVGGICVGYDTIEFFTKKMLTKQSYLEIGSFDGIAISLYAERYPDKKFYAVDIFGQGVNTGGGHKEYFKDNNKNNKNVWLYTDNSLGRLPKMVEEKLQFDIIFIDGDHGYNIVKSDIINSYKLLAPGGQIFLHDSSMEQIMHAVSDVCKELNITCTEEINMTCFSKG